MASLAGKLGLVACGVVIAGATVVWFIEETVGVVKRVKTVYEFSYQGKPALVREEDRLIGKDTHYILLNGRDRFDEGTLITDDGKKIVITDYGRFRLYEQKESWERIK